MIGRLARFRRDPAGSVAIEFAMIAPILITFYFGLAELTQGLMAERRASHAAAAIGDLVAQTSQVSSADITDVFAITATLMKPFPTTNLKMRVTSVTANSAGKAVVDWSEGQGLAANAPNAILTVPSGLIISGQSLIIAEVQYPYESVLKYVVKSPINFNEIYYLRPRKSDKVTKVS